MDIPDGMGGLKQILHGVIGVDGCTTGDLHEHIYAMINIAMVITCDRKATATLVSLIHVGIVQCQDHGGDIILQSHLSQYLGTDDIVPIARFARLQGKDQCFFTFVEVVL